jgi:membrane protein
VPLGGSSPEVTRDLHQLFPARNTVRGITHVRLHGACALKAFSWPAAVQRGYELALGHACARLRPL